MRKQKFDARFIPVAAIMLFLIRNTIYRIAGITLITVSILGFVFIVLSSLQRFEIIKLPYELSFENLFTANSRKELELKRMKLSAVAALIFAFVLLIALPVKAFTFAAIFLSIAAFKITVNYINYTAIQRKRGK